MNQPPEILTKRLSLRPPTEADAERVYVRYVRDPEVCRFLTWKPHCSVDETRAYLRKRIDDNGLGKWAGYLIFSRTSGELLGSVGSQIQETQAQFGYCLARDAWGQGFATEAASAFVDTIFSDPAIWRIQALCDLENSASARVLEKCGLTREGILRRYFVMPNLSEAPRDVYCYAKVRE